MCRTYLPYTLFIKSDIDDVKLADSEDMTLGKYELKDIHYLEELESCVENDIDYNRLDKFILANSKLIEDGQRIRKEIANMENKSKNDDNDSNNNNSNNSNDDDDDDDEEDDDDDDD